MRKTTRVISHLGIIIVLLSGVLGFGPTGCHGAGLAAGAAIAAGHPQGVPPAPSRDTILVDTGAPLVGVVLTLNLTRWVPPVGGPTAPPPAVRTGATAHTPLVPCNRKTTPLCLARVRHPRAPVSHSPCDLHAGQATQNIDFRLQPAAAIRATYTTNTAIPSGMTAAVFCPNPDLDPRRKLKRVLGNMPRRRTTRGIFACPKSRLNVFVAIAAHNSFFGVTLKRARFYPDADSMEKAQIVEVKPGQEISQSAFPLPPRLLPEPSARLERGAADFAIPLRQDRRWSRFPGGLIGLTPANPLPKLPSTGILFATRTKPRGDAPGPPFLGPAPARDGAYTFAVVEPRADGQGLKQGFVPLAKNGPPENQP